VAIQPLIKRSLTLEASARQTDCPRKTRGLEENLGAADVDMTGEPFERIEAELAKIEIHCIAPTRT